MSNVPLINEQVTSAEVKKIEKDLKEVLDVNFLPNYFKPMTLNESVFKGLYLMYKQILYEGVLPNSLKELIFFTIALKLECAYCSSLHYANLHRMDVKESLNILEDVSTIKNELIRKTLEFSIKTMETPQKISDSDLKKLKEVGLNKEEILEIIAVASFATSNIKASLALKIPIDDNIDEYLNEQNIKLNVA
jgi:uncharacterized peroxidase-related enzyme